MMPRRGTKQTGVFHGFSLLLCAGLAFCYVARSDAVAAVTVWPVGFWLLPGFLLLALGTMRGSGRTGWLSALCWTLFLLLLAEEPLSLMRGWISHDTLSPGAVSTGQLRVVSLNCAGGSTMAAAETAAVHPDIVLLQESPSRKDLEILRQTLFGGGGSFAWGVDGSVLCRGTIHEHTLPRN